MSQKLKKGTSKGHFYLFDIVLDQDITDFAGKGNIDPGTVNNIIYNRDFNLAVMGNFDGFLTLVEIA